MLVINGNHHSSLNPSGDKNGPFTWTLSDLTHCLVNLGANVAFSETPQMCSLHNRAHQQVAHLNVMTFVLGGRRLFKQN
jgi:hypothetical protein